MNVPVALVSGLGGAVVAAVLLADCCMDAEVPEIADDSAPVTEPCCALTSRP